ncbi:MAG: hypothetical protein JO039_17350 [Solirubrobacterales bacterium]|nr:hypothetical protein [Solirubrobacterales bacterium]
MNAIRYDRPEQDWQKYEEPGLEEPLPGRPRRRLWGRGTAILLGLILCGAGFYAGVRVEKSQFSSSSSTSPFSAAARAGAGGGGGFAPRLAAGAGAGGGSGGGGLRALFAGAGGGNSSFGMVTSVNGNSLYITEASGNTVKVTLSSATKVTKSVGVSKSAVRPGDTVIVTGVKNSGGTVAATSVSDTGAGNTSSTSNSSSGNTSASSAVGSLFGGGG